MLYATGLVGECVAFGVPNDMLGQSIQVIATPPEGRTEVDVPALTAACKARMPAYMVPHGIDVRSGHCRATPTARSTARPSPPTGWNAIPHDRDQEDRTGPRADVAVPARPGHGWS